MYDNVTESLKVTFSLTLNNLTDRQHDCLDRLHERFAWDEKLT